MGDTITTPDELRELSKRSMSDALFLEHSIVVEFRQRGGVGDASIANRLFQISENNRRIAALLPQLMLHSDASPAVAQLKLIRHLSCPKDTDGDGGCGRFLCPYCGSMTDAALDQFEPWRPERPADAAT